jgi:hypothetical protein
MKCQEILCNLREARISLRSTRRWLTVGNIVIKKKLKAAGGAIEQVLGSRGTAEDLKNQQFCSSGRPT